MTLEDFVSLMEQIKTGPASRRLVFIWKGPHAQLKDYLSKIEIHWFDIVSVHAEANDKPLDYRKTIEVCTRERCKEYQEKRSEPSVLVIENAILLARYGCSLSFLFQYAISPQSAVVLMIPPESRREMPIRTHAWVKRNTSTIMSQVVSQLGESGCVVEI